MDEKIIQITSHASSNTDGAEFESIIALTESGRIFMGFEGTDALGNRNARAWRELPLPTGYEKKIKAEGSL